MNRLLSAILGRVLGDEIQETGAHRRLIVGLGNPGTQYAQTRHNFGFWCVDRLAELYGIDFSIRRQSAVVGEGGIEGVAVALAKPRTFVNRSGEAVRYLLDRYRSSPHDLLVVHDDLALPLGRLRLRPSGSSGGHNGVRSIIKAIGSQDFPRMRMGIGQPPHGVDQVEYVLGSIPPQERDQAREAVERATEAAVAVLVEGMTEAMNRYN